MLLQAKEYLETPEAEGGKEGFSSAVSRETLAFLTPLKQHRDLGLEMENTWRSGSQVKNRWLEGTQNRQHPSTPYSKTQKWLFFLSLLTACLN